MQTHRTPHQWNAAVEWVSPPVETPRVQFDTFDSAAVGRRVSYHVYLPEAYELERRRRFPVLYWLHGTGGGVAGIPFVAGRLDAAISTSRIPPILAVFPNGLANSLWVDSKDGGTPMETVLMKELLPHIDATYRTLPTREDRMVEGFSMGGYGAARLGFKYHQVFGAVSILSGGPLQQEFTETPLATAEERAWVFKHVFGDDPDYFSQLSPWVLAELNAEAVKSTSRVRMVIGGLDKMLRIVRRFETHLVDLGIPHSYREVAGVDHGSIALLDALGDSHWDFHRMVFGAGTG
jgi:enterochelin esterase-like enzyme